MKEFNKTNTVTYNLITYTGFKSLLLFSLLLESPKSYEEIIEYFKNHPHLKEEVSVDTIRVYLTSLKKIGCEIHKTNKAGGKKFYITKHPYEFNINDKQIKGIIKIYKILQNTIDVNDLIIFEKFIRQLAEKINNPDFTDAINKVSLFKKINMNLLDKLVECTKNKNSITILYNSPTSGKKEIKVITDKLGIYRNNIYLYGISLEYKQDTSYLVSRIIDIVDIDENNDARIEIAPITVGYELGTLTPGAKLSENEKIVEIKDNSVIIEAQTTNLFMMKRKILDYGGLCTVLYPEDFRNDIINTLKEMREVYNND